MPSNATITDERLARWETRQEAMRVFDSLPANVRAELANAAIAISPISVAERIKEVGSIKVRQMIRDTVADDIKRAKETLWRLK